MAVTAISSKDFNQYVTDAKRAAERGPVFITDRGKPSHVLLSFTEYQRITQQRRNIVDALSLDGAGDIDFDPPRIRLNIRGEELS